MPIRFLDNEIENSSPKIRFLDEEENIIQSDPKVSRNPLTLAAPLARGVTMGLGDRIAGGLAALASKGIMEGQEALGGRQAPTLGQLYRQGVGEVQSIAQEARKQYPVTSPALEIGGALGSGIATGATAPIRALGNLAGRGGTIGKIGAGALAGETAQRVYEAGVSNPDEFVETLGREGVSLGGVLGGAIPAAGALINKLGSLATPLIDDAIKPLINKAKSFDIPLRRDQVSDTKINRTLQKISQAIPASGTDTFEDLQRTKFTQAVAKTIGLDDVPALNPEAIKKFKEQNSNAFERGLGEGIIDIAEDELSNITDVKKVVAETLGLNNRDARILVKTIDDVATSLDSGSVTPQKLSNIRSDIIEKSAKSGVGSPVYDVLLERIESVAERVGNPEVLRQARRQYRNYKTIQPLIEETETGIISPTKLMQRVKSSKYIDSASIGTGEDDLIDLARIGKLLKIQGGSDTFEKTALTGQIAGGAGLLVDPVSTLTLGSGLLAGNRALQKGIMQNQGLINRAAQQNVPALLTNQSTIRTAPALGSLSAIQQQGVQ